MTDPYLRAGKSVDSFSRLFPGAWSQVDGFHTKTEALNGTISLRGGRLHRLSGSIDAMIRSTFSGSL